MNQFYLQKNILNLNNFKTRPSSSHTEPLRANKLSLVHTA